MGTRRSTRLAAASRGSGDGQVSSRVGGAGVRPATDASGETAAGLAKRSDELPFGEIEAGMRSLGWTWGLVGLAYIYIDPNARHRGCTAKNYTTFNEGVDYIHTQERFESFVREDPNLLARLRLTLDSSTRPSRRSRTKKGATPPTASSTSSTRTTEETAPLVATTNALTGGVESDDDEPISAKIKAWSRRCPAASEQQSQVNSSAPPPLPTQPALALPSDSRRDLAQLMQSDASSAEDDNGSAGAMADEPMESSPEPVCSNSMTEEVLDRFDDGDTSQPSSPKRQKRIATENVCEQEEALKNEGVESVSAPTVSPPAPADMIPPLTTILERLRPESPAPSLHPPTSVTDPPLLHRAFQWRQLQGFIQRGLQADRPLSLVLHGPHGSGKTEMLRHVQAYAAEAYDQQLRDNPSAINADDTSTTPRSSLHVVYASMTGCNDLILTKSDQPQYVRLDGLFVDLVPALEAEFGAAGRYDPVATPARRICEQLLESPSSVSFPNARDPPVIVDRIIFLVVDGLNLECHDPEALLRFFDMVYSTYINMVHLIVTTTGPPTSFLATLGSRHPQRNTVATLASYKCPAIMDILMARLRQLDGAALRDDVVAFVSRFVELAAGGSVTVALAMCHHAILSSAGAVEPIDPSMQVKCIRDSVKIKHVLAAATTVLQLDVLPRCALILYAAVKDGADASGLYNARRVHEMYCSVLDAIPATHSLARSSYDSFHREVDWMHSHGLATWGCQVLAKDSFTIFVSPEEAMEVFNNTPWRTIASSALATFANPTERLVTL